MIAIPALEFRDGASVQLVEGSAALDREPLGDPLGIVRSWSGLGFRRIYLIDHDAAAGLDSNRSIVDEILLDGLTDIQVGGGVCSSDRIEQLFRAGASQVVVGSRALEEPDWLASQASTYPGLLIVATEVRDRRVVVRGWVRTLPVDVLDIVNELGGLPLGGILVTAVDLEGAMRGPDLALMEDVANASAVPVIASGGIMTVADLRALENRGIAGAVIGMALDSCVLDARLVAQEFGELSG